MNLPTHKTDLDQFTKNFILQSLTDLLSDEGRGCHFSGRLLIRHITEVAFARSNDLVFGERYKVLVECPKYLKKMMRVLVYEGRLQQTEIAGIECY